MIMMVIITFHFKFLMNCFKIFQTSIHFFRANSDLLSQLTFVYGLNCGFGNWENPLPVRYNLLLEWLQDLYFLTGTQLPLVFTCANDYADLSGENQIMQKLMGSYYLLPPTENPFGFASTFISSESKVRYAYSKQFYDTMIL